jgi:hypothetical protein
MVFLRNIRVIWIVLILAGISILLRLQAYGDLRLSIANNDTASYVTSAEVKLSSWEAFTGRRLFSTNLLFQIYKPAEGYEILVNGSGDTTLRQIQPTFAGIAIFQNILSMLGWTVLVIVIATRLKNGIFKILVAVIFLGFAFLPQLAEWDSILTSESLTISLFALQFGLLILLVFRFFAEPEPTKLTVVLVLVWLVIVFLWTFLKDGNLYTLVADGLIVLGLPFFRSARKRRLIFFALIVLAAIFGLGWVSARQSSRSQIQLQHVYEVNILPATKRVEFMKLQGMPEPSSTEFKTWFRQHAQSAYIKFLVSHPGYILTSYARDSLAGFQTGIQPYFTNPQQPERETLIAIGEVVHPSNSSPLLMDTLLLLGVWVVTLRKQPESGLAWACLGSWLFLAAHFNMFVSVFGDAYALPRHALPATMMFRMLMWLLPIVLIDLALLPARSKHTVPVTSNPNQS